MSLTKIAASGELALESAARRIATENSPAAGAFISALATQFLRTFPFPTHFAHHFHASPQQAEAMRKWAERFDVAMAVARHAGVSWSMAIATGEMHRALPDFGPSRVGTATNLGIARAFNDEATGIASKAAQEKWSKTRYEREIRTLGKSYGAEGLQTGRYAAAFDTAVSAEFNQGVLETFSKDPIKRLFPYLAIVTKRDNRVRPTHRLLDKFMARSDWPGWKGLIPPLDFRCRCLLTPVPAAIAKQARYTGDFPLGGALRYSAWIATGGSSPGFSRAQFFGP